MCVEAVSTRGISTTQTLCFAPHLVFVCQEFSECYFSYCRQGTPAVVLKSLWVRQTRQQHQDPS